MSSSGDSKSGIFSWTTSRSSSQNSHRPLTPKQAPATDEVSEAIQPTAQSEASSRKFSHLDFIQLVRDGDIKGVRRTFDKCESMEEVEAYANAVGRRGQSALVVAIRNEYPNLARLLLKVGADPTFECDYPEPGTTPLRVAFETDRPNVQKMVCEAWTYQQLEAGVLTRMQDLRKFFKPEQASARVVAQRVLVKTYASCEPATFAHVVAPRFQVQPAQTLLDLLSLAAAMFRDSVRMEAIEPLMADTLRSGSVRLQLLAAGCLSMIGSVKDGLGRYECDELLRCPKGMDVLRVALQNGLKTFIAQPGTQSYVRREWSGPLLGRIADPDSTMPTGERLRLFCIFFVAFLCNALLVLASALLPFLESMLYDYLLEQASRPASSSMLSMATSPPHPRLACPLTQLSPSRPPSGRRRGRRPRGQPQQRSEARGAAGRGRRADRARTAHCRGRRTSRKEDQQARHHRDRSRGGCRLGRR